METWKDVDEKLKEISVIDLVTSEADAVRKEALLVAEAAYATATHGLTEKRKVIAEEIERFYRVHRKEVEREGKRSIDLTYGRLGMRKGKPTLKRLAKWKWEDVTAAIKAQFAKKKDLLESLIQTKESLRKDAIKSRITGEDLAAIGLKIDQPDEFFMDVFPQGERPQPQA
jgi:phage host-nuclease inhibitor protein Gam